MATSDKPSLHRRAPAKVNLTLAIHGRRPDGFHELESWVVPVDFCDELVFQHAPQWSLTVTGDRSVPADASNLVWKAAELMSSESGHPMTAAIALAKRIPSGAGLGGGSSDAAQTLLGLSELWALHWPTARLAALASRLGSDVPLFLHGRGCVMRGRGERVEAAPIAWSGWVVLLLPRFGVSTAAVYRAWSATGGAGKFTARDDRLADVLRHFGGDTGAWSPLLFNDLEEAAFTCEPRLAALHGQVSGLAGRHVRMTGSGSGLFAVFDTQSAAREWGLAARSAAGSDVDIVVVQTL